MLLRVTWGVYQSSFGGVEGRGSLVGLNFKERERRGIGDIDCDNFFKVSTIIMSVYLYFISSATRVH